MDYILPIREQLAKILNTFYNDIKVDTSDSHDLNDIKSGEIYKSLLNGECRDSLINKSSFTLTINTDGVQLCEKSNMSIWPVFIVINELPLCERYCIENTIVAGT